MNDRFAVAGEGPVEGSETLPTDLVRAVSPTVTARSARTADDDPLEDLRMLLERLRSA